MCGVVGVVLPEHGHEAAAVAATALFALQHRGQESAGIGVSDGRQLMIYKDLGMVGQVSGVAVTLPAERPREPMVPCVAQVRERHLERVRDPAPPLLCRARGAVAGELDDEP